MANVYFALTEEFNARGVVALLASGQAVVYYRIALMSKDGDWVVRESSEACQRVRAVLASHGARYRPGAPLDPRWLAGGWSSHFVFFDAAQRRLRCDFVSRPPRVPATDLDEMFRAARGEAPLRVVDPGTAGRGEGFAGRQRDCHGHGTTSTSRRNFSEG